MATAITKNILVAGFFLSLFTAPVNAHSNFTRFASIPVIAAGLLAAGISSVALWELGGCVVKTRQVYFQWTKKEDLHKPVSELYSTNTRFAKKMDAYLAAAYLDWDEETLNSFPELDKKGIMNCTVAECNALINKKHNETIPGYLISSVIPSLGEGLGLLLMRKGWNMAMPCKHSA